MNSASHVPATAVHQDDHGHKAETTTYQPGRPHVAPVSRLLAGVRRLVLRHVFVRRCAWCGHLRGIRIAWRHGGISDGICPSCAAAAETKGLAGPVAA